MSWDVFISHASEDKKSFVRPLAEKLRLRGLHVWYDEFTLTLGDSLRRSIDRGLAESRFGIVVLSRSFFEKEWTQRELDGLTAREIDMGKVILPIWHKVSREEVMRYSPVLADKLGVSTSSGLESVVAEIVKAIESLEDSPSVQSQPPDINANSSQVAPVNVVSSATLEVQFPYAVKCKADRENRTVKIGRIELENTGDEPILAGWRAKIGLLYGINRRVTLDDTILLPAISLGAFVPIGPFEADVPLDIATSEDEWQVEFYIIDSQGNEKLLFRSQSVSTKLRTVKANLEQRAAEVREDLEQKSQEDGKERKRKSREDRKDEPKGSRKPGKRKPKIRIYKLARELKLKVNQVIEEGRREGIDLRSPLNTITIEVAERIRQKYESKKVRPPEPTPTKKPTEIRIDLDGILAQASYAPVISASSDRAWLVSLHVNQTVHLWKMDDLSQHITIKPNSSGLPTSSAMRQKPSGWELVVALRDGFERWQIGTDGAHELAGLTPCENLVHVQFSDDGSLLLTASLDGLLKVTRTDNGKLIKDFHCKEQLRTATFCGGDHYVIAGSELGKTFVWDMDPKYPISTTNDLRSNPIFVLIGLSSQPLYIAASENNDMLTVRRCNHSQVWKKIPLKGEVICATYNKSGLIFAGLNDKTLLAQEMLRPKVHWQKSMSNLPIAMTTAGRRYLAVANEGDTIEIRNTENGQNLGTLIGFGADDWLAISADNHMMGEGYERFLGNEGEIFKRFTQQANFF